MGGNNFMSSHCEFFKNQDWHKIVKNNFKSDTRVFFDAIVPVSGGEKAKIPLVKEEIEILQSKKIVFGRYGSVYLSDYLDFSGSHLTTKESIGNLVFQSQQMGVEVLWLSNIPKESILHQALTEYSIDKTNCYFLECIPTLGVVCADNYEDYLSSLSKNSRRNIKRKLETLSKFGVKHRIVQASKDGVSLLLKNQASRASLTSLAPLTADQSLLNTIFEASKMKDVYISELISNKDTISQLLLLVKNKTIGILIQCFDPKFAQYSPSFCNFAHLIKYAYDNDFTYVDFLRGDEEYKKHFINHEIRMEKFITILNSTIEEKSLISFIERFEE